MVGYRPPFAIPQPLSPSPYIKGASIKVPGPPDVVISVELETLPAGMDTTTTPTTYAWTATIDGSPIGASAISWDDTKHLDVSFTHAVPAVSGVIAYDNTDPEIRNWDGVVMLDNRDHIFYP